METKPSNHSERVSEERQSGHTSEILVKTGELVERGHEIAKVGNTGRSTGPHLHYTVEVGGKARDPLDYILD